MSLRPASLALAVAVGLLVIGCASGGEESAARTAAERPPGQTAGPADTRRALPAATGARLLLLGRFSQPTYITAPRGDRARRFVVERAGRIISLRGRRRAVFLDIRGRVQTGGESGLLSMAFPPDYARSRRFYVYFTDNQGYIRIEQFQRSRGSADRALPGSARVVLRIPHFRFNHKGGQLQFGPDGFLYAGFGDGGGSGDPDRAAQDTGRLLGKLIRIDPQPGGGYRIPPGNPFRGRGGARPEVYAYGLRNPYRFSFDRAAGHLTIGDVGQNAVEEISFVRNTRGRGRTPRGGYNFGWSLFEGRSRFRSGSAPGHRPPAVTHSHDAGWCSITGGYVLRDRSLGRGLYGRYVYGDYCQPSLRVAALRNGRSPTRRLGPQVPGLVSFGEDARGRVYAVSLNGPVYRLAPR